MKNKKLLFALLLLPTASNADKLSYGISPEFISVSVADEEGDTETESTLQPLSGILIYEGRRDTRWMEIISVYDFDIDATETTTGMTVESFSLTTNYQWRQRWGRSFKPWIGIGGSITFDKFTSRHLVDGDGFLLSSFEDREETNFVANVNFSNEWEISKPWKVGFNLSYNFPIDDGVEGIKLNLTILY